MPNILYNSYDDAWNGTRYNIVVRVESYSSCVKVYVQQRSVDDEFINETEGRVFFTGSSPTKITGVGSVEWLEEEAENVMGAEFISDLYSALDKHFGF